MDALARTKNALSGQHDVVPGLVSVIIPVYNRETMLRDAIACVDAQTYRPIEMILVDDGSTDGTGRLCDEMASDRPGHVKVIHQPNGGPGLAREAGRLVARGEFLQYLDSDDWLHPRKIERQVAVLQANPDAGVCYCITHEVWSGADGERRISLRTGERTAAIFPAFLLGRLWQTVSPLWRRSASDLIGPWEGLRVEEDLEYDARAGGLGIQPVWCSEPLAEHRHHTGPRAGTGELKSAGRMRDRATSHEKVLRHARVAGIGNTAPEMRRYARELFFLARQCGAEGLVSEAKRLMKAALEAAGSAERWRFSTVAFRVAAFLFGWAFVSRLAASIDRRQRRGEVVPSA